VACTRPLSLQFRLNQYSSLIVGGFLTGSSSLPLQPLNFKQTVTLSWNDGATTVSSQVAHAGDAIEYTNRNVASISTAIVPVTTNFSGGNSTLVLLYVFANYTQDTGPVTMTMTPPSGSPIIVNMVPSDPFVWSSVLAPNNPSIPNGISSFTFTNPNISTAAVQIRLLAIL
jgi:hypothetical protein